MAVVKVCAGAAAGVLAAGLWSGAWAQKGKCEGIPPRWFIYPVATMLDGSTVQSAISGDGNWYSASSGTSNTVIHWCGENASNDATVLMSRKRKLTVALPAPVTGSVIEESLSGTYQNSAFMNVRNILCYGCTKAPFEPFTTRMGLQFPALVNRQDYRLRFTPFVTDSPDRHTNPDAIPAENTPYEGSPVLVLPQPYDCTTGGSTKPSWIVRGTNASIDPNVPAAENLQIGTLSRIEAKGTRHHAGQYSLPFEIRIEALSCFSY